MAHHHDSDGVTHEAPSDAALADLLDLDGAVLHSYWTDVLHSVWQAAAGTERRRIVDIGAGTGVGTVALAQLFPGAEVIAVDVSDEMLGRIRAKAVQLGLADRVRTVHADLNDDWPAVDAIDITWASLSLHHLVDPDRVLRSVFASTRPGGLMAVAEFGEPLRFLPDELGFGRPGLESRCLDALRDEHAHALPELGSDWSERLTGAGFRVLSDRAIAIELTAPHSPEATRYAREWLQRMRSGVAARLEPDDLEALAVLIDGDGPASLRRRTDLQIRGTRTVTLARLDP